MQSLPPRRSCRGVSQWERGPGVIVKVQVSLTKPPMALFYNEDKSVLFEERAGAPLLRLMKDRPKAFFHAKINKSNMLEIEREAKWQTW
jgi:hypothetical protein